MYSVSPNGYGSGDRGTIVCIIVTGKQVVSPGAAHAAAAHRVITSTSSSAINRFIIRLTFFLILIVEPVQKLASVLIDVPRMEIPARLYFFSAKLCASPRHRLLPAGKSLLRAALRRLCAPAIRGCLATVLCWNIKRKIRQHAVCRIEKGSIGSPRDKAGKYSPKR